MKNKKQKHHEPTNFHERFHFPKKRKTLYLIVAGAVVVAGSLLWGGLILFAQPKAADKNTANQASANQAVNIDTTFQTEPEPTELPRALDGIIVDPAAANLFVYAVMLDNNPAARPQAGLAQASVVYNTLVEGGATRLMAVFSSDVQPGRIGPVRSARPYYLEWLSEYDGMYVHAGGSPEALQTISAFDLRAVNCIGSGGRYCYRDNTGYAPHNLFTDNEKLAYAIRDLGYEQVKPEYDTWRFKDEDALDGRGDFNWLELHYSAGTYNVRYEYNKENNAYLRFNGTDPHLDRTTEEQIAAKNVIVQVVPPIVTYLEKGRIVLNVTGEGKAFLFRDGLVIPGTWEKPLRVERTKFIAEDGTEMKLNRGQTWVEVIPEGREFPYQ
ncbi:MAG: DUF3048 domain-containing protein [bacterium]